MSIAEIIIRTEDQDDAIVIANTIANGLDRVGFDNVSTSIVGSTELTDPELTEAMRTINPDIFAIAIDITYEPITPAGAVDEVLVDIFDTEPEETDEEGED